MSEEAAREEAYLNKLMNKPKDPKKVFGGGLEAARKGQAEVPRKTSTSTATPVTLSGGGVPANKPPSSHTAPVHKPSPAVAPVHKPNPTPVNRPAPAFVPPPLECEVVELDLPLPGPPASNLPPPVEESTFLHKALGEEAARKEEERMGKSIGRFAAPKSVLAPNVQPPPVTSYTIPPAYSQNTTHAHPQHPPSHPQNPPSHQQPHYPAHHTNPAPKSSTPVSTSPPAPKNITFDPSSPMVVGNITPSPDPTANFLPFTSVGCPLESIRISVLKNGKNLQVRRELSVNGENKIETKSLILPYQVTPHTTAATYYPGKSNGELSIKLGKTLPRSASTETEVTSFTVMANPGSNSERVQINVAQESDHFTFSPGPAARYETQFTVVVVGSSLEFRSVYSFQEGNAIKTVNGKQVIQLAIPPTIDQIDVSGDTLTVWPNRGSPGVEEIVADFDVAVSLGH